MLSEEAAVNAAQIFQQKAPALAQRLSCESEGCVHSMYTIWVLERGYQGEVVAWWEPS